MAIRAGDYLLVLHTFKGQKSEDLPCKKGDKLKVVKLISDENWVFCSNSNNKQGLVPVNHIKLLVTPTLDEPWFRGQISRREAEEALKDTDDGDFVVRISDKYPGDFTLCVKFDSGFQFYHIVKSKKGFTLDEVEWFETVPKLIKHYQDDADGLCCQLKPTELSKVHHNTITELEAGGYLIPVADLEFGQKIGCGEFSEVLQGKYKSNPVAIKCFKKTKSSEELFDCEASLMAKLKHPNLVKFIGVSYRENSVYIITEFMENGSLVNYLRSRGRSIIKPSDQINFALGACKGMMYLEEHCLVHRDLAARNILLSAYLEAKVSDFGLAKFVDDRKFGNNHHSSSGESKKQSETSQMSQGSNATANMDQKFPNAKDLAFLDFSNSADDSNANTNRIPVKWTAPEALSKSNYTTKSDVWSYGILLWEIYSFGRTPYPKIYANDVKTHLKRGYRMDAPEDTPKEMYELMRACWALEPDKRPSFKDIFKILKDISSNSLYDAPNSITPPPVNSRS